MADLIVALDLPTGEEALRLLDRIPEAGWVKLGSVLFTREGPGLVERLISRGLRIFLDLKWHDIPNTVAGAVSAASALGVSLATVHTMGGAQMMEAAKRGAAGTLRLVGVTVLTSHDADSFGAVVGRPVSSVEEEAVRLARSAAQAGLDGIVCSPLEAARLKPLLPKTAWVVVPGIRRPADPAGDQARTATPSAAVRAGATHLVVGRPILQAVDPGAVFREMNEDVRCT